MENQEYIEARNALIPLAEQYANESAGPTPPAKRLISSWAARWNEFFHKKMNELAMDAGLTKGG